MDDELYEVESPSGSTFALMNQDEVDYFQRVSEKYYSDNAFSNITDMQDVDRVVSMELLVYRWSAWVLSEEDYNGHPINPTEYRKQISEYSTEIRQTKKMLGIDRKSREGEGQTVADYIENLRKRAQEFGIKRNEEAAKAIELFHELKAFVELHLNCDEEERKEEKCNQEDIIQWIIEVAIPEFNEIDEKFRDTSQKYWIQDI